MNSLDDDCDGLTDEDNPEGGTACYPDQEGCTQAMDGTFTCLGVCTFGRETCVNGVIVCQGVTVPAERELCNNLDDNCNGDVDEGLLSSCVTPEVDYEPVGAC